MPGNLLRFDATIKLSSTANRTLFAQDAVKGIVMGEPANRTSYQPIDITQLPYSAKPPVCARTSQSVHWEMCTHIAFAAGNWCVLATRN